MSEAVTPPKWIVQHQNSDRRRIDELEARVKALEAHWHNTSPTGQTGGPCH